MSEIIFTKAKPVSSDYCKMWVRPREQLRLHDHGVGGGPYRFFVFNGEALPKPVTYGHLRTAKECMAHCRWMELNGFLLMTGLLALSTLIFSSCNKSDSTGDRSKQAAAHSEDQPQPKEQPRGLKITSNTWSNDNLHVEGKIDNPTAGKFNFKGFDADQQLVAESDYYTIEADGTFTAFLGDANKAIKFIKVELSSGGEPPLYKFVSDEGYKNSLTEGVNVPFAQSVTTPFVAANPVIQTSTYQPASPAHKTDYWLMFLMFCLYFLPSTIAMGKRHFGAIILLNLLAGWTFIGWIVALVWASVSKKMTVQEGVESMQKWVKAHPKLAIAIGNFIRAIRSGSR